MQYRVYSKKTLSYIDGGYVSPDKISIDDDYLICNSSVFSILNPTKAAVGDIVVLIKDVGPYHKGIITAVDNEELTISYKDVKEMFNNNILNPFRTKYIDDKNFVGKFLNLSANVAIMINDNFVKSIDPQLNLPIKYYEFQGNTEALWKYSDNQINFKDFLIDMFNKYNLVIDFDINFNSANNNNNMSLTIKLSVVSQMGTIIKDNMQIGKFIYEESTLPDNTVCILLDKSTKEELARYYLRVDNTVTKDIHDLERALPARYTAVEYSDPNESEAGNVGDIYVDGKKVDIPEQELPQTSEEELERNYELTAKDTLCSSSYYELVQLEIDKNSKMIDFDFLSIGSGVKIVNEQGIIDTIYTGRKENNGSSKITLMFGKSRKDYTDKIQLALRRSR